MEGPRQGGKAVIGNSENFWLHSSRNNHFDLTHPSSPSANLITPRLGLTTNATSTSASRITVDPAKTALVIIDMQNFFLSEAFGRTKGPGHAACDNLRRHAIPAARKAGVRIVWLNWGLTQQDVDEMPPAVKRAFGFEAVPDDAAGDSMMPVTGGAAAAAATTTTTAAANHGQRGNTLDDEDPGELGHPPQLLTAPKNLPLENGKDGRVYKGLGSQCGTILTPDGQNIDAGRLLMRDSWNAALFAPLDELYEEGSKLPHNPDVWIHKDRMSGLWGASTSCERFLEEQGIRSLLFAGVNTDQCVSGTFTDAFSKGYDCILLSDGCGTTSPEYAQQCIEFNAAKTWGFTMSCEDFARGVEDMEA